MTKCILVAVLALALGGCAGLSVPDALAKLDELTLQCRGAVSKLSDRGINVVSADECDKSASQARAKLVELLDRLREELRKAGV